MKLFLILSLLLASPGTIVRSVALGHRNDEIAAVAFPYPVLWQEFLVADVKEATAVDTGVIDDRSEDTTTATRYCLEMGCQELASSITSESCLMTSGKVSEKGYRRWLASYSSFTKEWELHDLASFDEHRFCVRLYELISCSSCALREESMIHTTTCCDPAKKPGANGNPFCIEGTTCCQGGFWSCNDGAGQSICPDGNGPVCPARKRAASAAVW